MTRGNGAKRVGVLTRIVQYLNRNSMYPEHMDTHEWHAKQETLRRLKTKTTPPSGKA